MLDVERTDLTLVCQTTLSVPEGKLDTGNIYPLANVASAKLAESVAVGSPTIRLSGRHDNVISNMDEVSIEDDGRIGAILHFGLHLVHFRGRRTVCSRCVQ